MKDESIWWYEKSLTKIKKVNVSVGHFYFGRVPTKNYSPDPQWTKAFRMGPVVLQSRSRGALISQIYSPMNFFAQAVSLKRLWELIVLSGNLEAAKWAMAGTCLQLQQWERIWLLLNHRHDLKIKFRNFEPDKLNNRVLRFKFGKVQKKRYTNLSKLWNRSKKYRPSVDLTVKQTKTLHLMS